MNVSGLVRYYHPHNLLNIDFVKLSIPFTADEISNSMQEKDFTNVKPAIELADNPSFLFLKDWDLFGPFFIWPLIRLFYGKETNCIVVPLAQIYGI